MQRYAGPATWLILLMMLGQSLRNGGFSDPGTWMMTKAIILPGIIIGLSFHEFAHAWIAVRLGDNTPRLQGRVTLSPTAHIHLMGFVALLLIGFGWGKPVEINPNNFKNRRRDELLVAVAGVVMNLLIAIICTVLLRIYIQAVGVAPGLDSFAAIIGEIIFYIIYINLVLMVFNLLPVPPLDGFNIITELFDLKRYDWWYAIYNHGFFILLLLILFDITDLVLTPALRAMLSIVYGAIM